MVMSLRHGGAAAVRESSSASAWNPREVRTDSGLPHPVFHAQDLLHSGGGEEHGTRLFAFGVDVYDAFGYGAAGHLLDQLGGAAEGEGREVGAEAFFEADGGFGAEAEVRGGAAIVGGVEAGGLQDNVCGGIGDAAVEAADDAAEGAGVPVVGDDEVVGAEGDFDFVQGGHGLAGVGAADVDAPTEEGFVVEGVEGLSVFQHDVVGDVHHVVDGANVGEVPAASGATGGRGRRGCRG